MSGLDDKAHVSGTQQGTAKQYRLLILNYQCNGRLEFYLFIYLNF